MKEQELFESKFGKPHHWIVFDEVKSKYVCEQNPIDHHLLIYQAQWEAWQESANREGYKLILIEMSWEDWQPDWSQAPNGFDWWAKDGFSNKAHWYNKEPFLDDGDEEYPNEWIQIENSYTYTDAPLFNYQGDWKDSLRKRT